MEGLLFFRVYPSDGFRFILIPDGNPSHEFPVLDGNPSSNMNSAIPTGGLRKLIPGFSRTSADFQGLSSPDIFSNSRTFQDFQGPCTP